MSKTIKQLEKEVGVLNEQIWKLEIAERKKEAQKLIGKCFKYHNSYGSGKKWWLYVKVVGMDDHGQVETVEFQVENRGVPDLKRGLHYPHSLYGDGSYVRIPRTELVVAWAEFVAAYEKIARQLTAQEPVRGRDV